MTKTAGLLFRISFFRILNLFRISIFGFRISRRRRARMSRAAGVVALVLSAQFTSFAAAELRFTTPTVELGDVRAGVPLAQVFRFTNTGPDTVTLTQVQPGCGCLRPRMEQRSYAPGESGVIPLDIRTLGQAAGPHRWYMTVLYADGAVQREQKLEVVGNVVTEVSVQPAGLVLFAEGALAHEVTLTDLRPQPLTIERVETTSPQLRAAAGPLVKDAFGHWTSHIRVETTGQLPPGQQNEMLTIRTSDPLYRELQVSVTIIQRVGQRIVATPAEPTLSAGPRLVRLRDTQDQAVVIESVAADDPAIRCSWAAGPDNEATLKLQADRAALGDRSLHTAVRVQLSRPVRDVLTLPVVVPND
jgi:hypothetical protein